MHLLLFFLLLIYVCFNCNIEAYSSVQRKWDFLLPRPLLERIFALESDPSADKMKVERGTDELLRTLPQDILDELELPQFYSRLPPDVHWQIRQLLFDRNLDWRQKHERIFQIIQSVPPPLRAFPPPFAATSNDFQFISPPNGRPQKQQQRWHHSRLFDSTLALKYTINFTFKLQELRETLPMEKFLPLYDILANDAINIEQKLLAIDRSMWDLPFPLLDRLFFVGNLPMDGEIRERFRRLWYGRPYWNNGIGMGEEGNGADGMEKFDPPSSSISRQQLFSGGQPILLWPRTVPSQPSSSSFGRVSIRTQPMEIHRSPIGEQQEGGGAGKTTAFSIDEHYNVIAPVATLPSSLASSAEGGGGEQLVDDLAPPAGQSPSVCAECNGIPKEMLSIGAIGASARFQPPSSVEKEEERGDNDGMARRGKGGGGIRIRMMPWAEEEEEDGGDQQNGEEEAAMEILGRAENSLNFTEENQPKGKDPLESKDNNNGTVTDAPSRAGKMHKKRKLLRRKRVHNRYRVHNMNRLLMNILESNKEAEGN